MSLPPSRRLSALLSPRPLTMLLLYHPSLDQKSKLILIIQRVAAIHRHQVRRVILLRQRKAQRRLLSLRLALRQPLKAGPRALRNRLANGRRKCLHRLQQKTAYRISAAAVSHHPTVACKDLASGRVVEHEGKWLHGEVDVAPQKRVERPSADIRLDGVGVGGTMTEAHVSDRRAGLACRRFEEAIVPQRLNDAESDLVFLHPARVPEVNTNESHEAV